jgi:hypothetical protein
MNQDDINTIDLSDVKPVEFSWNESDMSTGITSQELGAIYSTMITAPSTVTLGSSPTISTVSINTGYTFSSTYDDIETRLARLEKIIAEEEEVRANHPAVQMAYDEYRLLYILSKKNAGDCLTDD